MQDLVPLFGILGFFGAIITAIYMGSKTRHRERMALIESGQNAEIFSEKQYHQGERGLKTGLFLIGGGMGFFLGNVTETVLGWDDGAAIAPLTAVGAGIGLVIFYILMSKRRED